MCWDSFLWSCSYTQNAMPVSFLFGLQFIHNFKMRHILISPGAVQFNHNVYILWKEKNKWKTLHFIHDHFVRKLKEEKIQPSCINDDVDYLVSGQCYYRLINLSPQQNTWNNATHLEFIVSINSIRCGKEMIMERRWRFSCRQVDKIAIFVFNCIYLSQKKKHYLYS